MQKINLKAIGAFALIAITSPLSSVAFAEDLFHTRLGAPTCPAWKSFHDAGDWAPSAWKTDSAHGMTVMKLDPAISLFEDHRRFETTMILQPNKSYFTNRDLFLYSGVAAKLNESCTISIFESGAKTPNDTIAARDLIKKRNGRYLIPAGSEVLFSDAQMGRTDLSSPCNGMPLPFTRSKFVLANPLDIRVLVVQCYPTPQAKDSIAFLNEKKDAGKKPMLENKSAEQLTSLTDRKFQMKKDIYFSFTPKRTGGGELRQFDSNYSAFFNFGESQGRFLNCRMHPVGDVTSSGSLTEHSFEDSIALADGLPKTEYSNWRNNKLEKIERAVNPTTGLQNAVLRAGEMVAKLAIYRADGNPWAGGIASDEADPRLRIYLLHPVTKTLHNLDCDNKESWDAFAKELFN